MFSRGRTDLAFLYFDQLEVFWLFFVLEEKERKKERKKERTFFPFFPFLRFHNFLWLLRNWRLIACNAMRRIWTTPTATTTATATPTATTTVTATSITRISIARCLSVVLRSWDWVLAYRDSPCKISSHLHEHRIGGRIKHSSAPRSRGSMPAPSKLFKRTSFCKFIRC